MSVVQVGDALWMATESKGLVLSTKEGTQILSNEPINDILQNRRSRLRCWKIGLVSPNPTN